jgi:UDP-N-acetylglucosamine 2-epimerase (non-hydrolysing)
MVLSIHPRTKKMQIKHNLKLNEKIQVIEPTNYTNSLKYLYNCFFCITDSGGIQEEAPTFGKPVLVMRDTTERMEGIEAGVARLVGTNRQMIAKNVQLLLSSENEYLKMSSGVNPYGDGTTAVQIRKIIDTVDLD